MKPGLLLIFDLDGTLFKAETVTVPAVQQTFEKFGLAVPGFDAICALFGQPGVDFHTWIGSLCPQYVRSRIIADIDKAELDLIGKTGELYPGIPQMLESLAVLKAHMALCTNSAIDYVYRILRTHRLIKHFETVRYWKSETDTKVSMVREILNHTGGTSGIVIGDRAQDLQAARENGLKSLAVLYGYGRERELAGADARASLPSDIPRLVRKLIQDS